MERTYCVICNQNIFTDIFNILNTINIVSSDNYNENEIKKLQFMGCNNCGCVQLKNLFLQSDIYSQPLQIFDGPNFKKHHDLFSEFIINNINFENEILEIGGAYGRLAKRIIQKYNDNKFNIKYKILEYDSKFYPPIHQIEYISGNCELYDYSNTKTIIMSHVLEHLYKPYEFLEKLSNFNVQNVFISIPDMDNLTLNGDLNNLNILHTFYINTQYITYLFSIFGYDLKKIENYNKNSNFYYFKKEQNINIPSYINLELPIQQKQFYDNNIQIIKNINIDSFFYICPSGFYGQFIYFHLNENTKKNLLGFLDSNSFKINKRLSGTNLLIFEKNIISDKNDVNILISSSKLYNEIKNELLTYNKNITFHN
jgi:2-polyprenyl-3-methyl-5-hydroxy-6-metoxy-1,4-benzoquinol methylase